MAENLNASQHVSWAEYIDQRLDVVYRKLCEYRTVTNMQNDDDPEVRQLLEWMICLDQAAKHLLPPQGTVANAECIDKQIDVLEKRLDFLKFDFAIWNSLSSDSDTMED